MHLQAAEDLRAEAMEQKKTGGSIDDSKLKLAELLGNGGLPKVARLDVSLPSLHRDRYVLY